MSGRCGIALLIVPPPYIASDDILARLAASVRNGGHVLMSFKSGFCDEFSTVRATRAPGPRANLRLGARRGPCTRKGLTAQVQWHKYSYIPSSEVRR